MASTTRVRELHVIQALLGTCAAGSALLLAACGGSSSSSKPTASAAAAGCRAVRAPAPKPGLRAPYPHLKLDPSHYYLVTLDTNCGKIGIALAVREAPQTAASFAWLVQRGFYDNLTFHRVVAGFVIQGGDPNGNGTGGPGYTVVEPPPAGIQYTFGTVAMAKTPSQPAGSSGSQFFIVTAANAGLPAEYALVGHVVEGEEVVRRIDQVPTNAGPSGENSIPREPVVIERATLSETP